MPALHLPQIKRYLSGNPPIRPLAPPLPQFFCYGLPSFSHADQELPERQPAHPAAHFTFSSVFSATVCPRSPTQIKSYLSGSPPIRLGLSENLILGRRDQRMLSSYGSDAGACCFQGAISLLRRPVLDPLLLLAAPRHRRPEHALLLSARACACACICGAPT